MHMIRVTALRDLMKSEYKQEKLLQLKSKVLFSTFTRFRSKKMLIL